MSSYAARMARIGLAVRRIPVPNPVVLVWKFVGKIRRARLEIRLEKVGKTLGKVVVFPNESFGKILRIKTVGRRAVGKTREFPNEAPVVGKNLGFPNRRAWKRLGKAWEKRGFFRRKSVGKNRVSSLGNFCWPKNRRAEAGLTNCSGQQWLCTRATALFRPSPRAVEVGLEPPPWGAAVDWAPSKHALRAFLQSFLAQTNPCQPNKRS